MADEHAIARYRHWYRKLLRFYSRPYRERFAESMEQTFNDLCRERVQAGERLLGFVLWVFVETCAGTIREDIRYIIMQNITRRLVAWAAVVALIMLVPFLAGGNEPWFGPLVWGTILFSAGLMYELIARNGGTVYRVATGIAVAAGLVLIWMNWVLLADDVVGPANFLYFGVLAIGFVGAFIARFQPKGMARVLFVMAIVHAFVPVIGLIFWSHDFNPGVADLTAADVRPGPVIVQTVFVALWVVVALLFQRAVDPWSTIPGEDRGRGASREGAAE
jgi:hypothetical protein